MVRIPTSAKNCLNLSVSQLSFFEETVNKKGLTLAQLVTCHIVFVRGQWVGSIFSIINGFIIERKTVLIRDRLGINEAVSHLLS